MKSIASALIVVCLIPAAAQADWAHVGNTYNSAIFVDRSVLAESNTSRPFRTLHVNTQLSAGWRVAEHRGTINCSARTLQYDGVVLTKLDGRRETLPSATTRPVPFPSTGLVRAFATAVCARRLGPAISDPEGWTKENFRPG